MTKRLVSIGVLCQKENNGAYHIVKEILANCGYKFLYNNVTFSILTNEDDFILIFDLTKGIAEKIKGLNLCLDIIIDSGLNKKDYYNPSIRALVKKSKYFIMNIDEKDSVNILSENIESLILTYGLNKKATVTASSLTIDRDIKTNICLQRECTTIKGNKIEPMEFPITIDLVGRSNFYNSLAAIAFGLIYGIPIENIKSSLLNIKVNSRLLEKIYHKDCIILANYCKDSSDYNFVFEEIQYMKHNDLYVIKGIDEDEEFFKIKSNLKVIFDWQEVFNIKKLFLFLDKKNSLITRNIESLLSNQILDYSFYTELQECVFSAINSLNKGDILLILGKDAVKEVKDIICLINK